MKISLGDGNITIIGKTRSGKSYGAKKIIKSQPNGALYFNTKAETSDLTGYIKIDGNINKIQLINLLKKGKKLNYEYKNMRELITLIKILLDSGAFTEKNYIYLVVDEVHLFNTDSKIINELIRLATIGVSKGVRIISISQRPAYIHNSLMSQSDFMIIFKTNMERDYFKRYNIPFDEIQNKLSNKKYHFITFDFEKVSDAKKI